jgi:HPt (histidine-containing phosphotransfer) domain-containing protein
MQSQAMNDSADVFDLNELMARCLGNIALVERSLAKFHSRLDSELSELERAAQSQDFDTLALVTHRLKGTSANLAAHALRDGAAGLEEAARNRRGDEIAARLAHLRSECYRFELASQNSGLAGAID